MLVRIHNQTLLRATRALAALALLLALAVPASAARVTDVRVGLHANFTRVVFETDTPARYRIQRGPGGEIQIHLAASAMPRRISTRSKLMSEVRVGPGGQGSTARVRLRGQDVKISELILLDPPRIVLDLRGTGAPVATAKATSKPDAKAAEAASAKKAAEAATAKKAAEAKKLADATAAKKAAEAAAAKKVADAAAAKKSAEAAAAKKLAEAASAQKSLAEAASKAKAGEIAGAEKLAAQTGGATQRGDATGLAGGEQARALAGGAAEKTTEAAAATAEKARQAAEATRLATERAAAKAAKAREKAAELARSEKLEVAPPASDASPLPAFLKDPVVLGGIGVAIALALGILIHQRRSGREDDYLSPASADDEPFSLDEGVSAAAAPEFEASAPEVAARPPLGAQDHETSHEDEEAAAVDTGMDTPIETTGYGAMPGAGASADVMSMMQEMERRITGLEKRVEEVTEAKERLERQVAAQTEELRVQRSAIARTQRALRSIARPEDEATEPVPKT